MTAVQTLAVGQTSHERNNAIAMLGGFSGIRMVPPLEQLKIALVGKRGDGKSALIQSCPDCYIFNLDLTPTVVPSRQAPAAIIWPGRHPLTGQAIEANPNKPNDPLSGIPVSLNFELIQAKKAILIDMAQKNVPGRPKCVAIDTSTALCDFVMDWMVGNAARSSPEKGITQFTQLHGKSAYPALYQHVYGVGDDLFRAGYGVIWVIHLGDKTVYLDAEAGRKEIARDVPMLPDNLFNTIGNNVDLVIAAEKEVAQKAVMVPQKGADGKPLMGADNKPLLKMETRTEVSYVLTAEPTSDRLRQTIKQRAGLPPRIPLSSKNPWKSFADAYRLAVDGPAA